MLLKTKPFDKFVTKHREFKTKLGPYCNHEHDTSQLSTSMDIINKQKIQLKEEKEDIQDESTFFQSFLDSKKNAFDFHPIFGTNFVIKISRVSSLEEDSHLPKTLRSPSPSGSLMDTINFNTLSISSNYADYSQNSVLFHSSRTEPLYREELLSPGFHSFMDDDKSC